MKSEAKFIPQYKQSGANIPHTFVGNLKDFPYCCMLYCIRNGESKLNKNKLCSLTCGGCFTRVSRGDPTPKKVLTRRQDLSDIGADFAYKTFFGVGSPNIKGSNPEDSLNTFPFLVPCRLYRVHDHIRKLRYVLKRRTTTTTTTLTQPIT